MCNLPKRFQSLIAARRPALPDRPSPMATRGRGAPAPASRRAGSSPAASGRSAPAPVDRRVGALSDPATSWSRNSTNRSRDALQRHAQPTGADRPAQLLRKQLGQLGRMHLGVLDPQPQHGVVGLAGTRLQFGQRLPGAGHQLRTPAPQESAVEVAVDSTCPTGRPGSGRSSPSGRGRTFWRRR